MFEILQGWSRLPRPNAGRKNQKKKKEKQRERKLVITMAKLRMAHASMHGLRKPPGPTEVEIRGLQDCYKKYSF